MASEDSRIGIKVDADNKDAVDKLRETEKEVDKLGDTAKQTSKETDGLGESNKKTGEETEGLGEKADKAASGVAALAVGAASAAAAMSAAAAAAIRVSSEFETAYAKTQTIMDQNEVSTDQMRNQILALSEDSAMAASNVSEAVYQAISGSVATKDAVGFVDKANKLSVAGFTSLNNATDILTTTLNAYQLEASKVAGVSNVLIQTQNLGKTSVDELASTMGRAISTGSAYKVNLQNLSTAYVELTRGGIATSEATTYLSGMLNELGDVGSNVGKILQEKTGKSFGQLMSDGWSLADVLQVLRDYTNGDAEALMGLWSSQEAGKASNAIMTQGIEDFNGVLAQMNQEMEGTTGTTDSAYQTMTNTSDYIDRRFKNSIQNLGIAFGDKLRPGLDGAKKLFTGFLEDVTEFVKKHPGIVSAFTGIATAVTALATAYAALLIAKKAAVAIEALNIAINSNPWMLLASAIAGVVAGLYTLITASDDASVNVEELTVASSALKDTMREAMESVEDSVSGAESAAKIANTYIGSLERMEVAGVRTEEEHREWHNTLVLLTQTIPELAELIDLETDTINGGTAALRDQTKQWVANAKAQAYQQYITETTEKYTQALIEQEKNTYKLSLAQTKLNTLEKEQQATMDEMTKAQNEAQNTSGATQEYWERYYRSLQGHLDELGFKYREIAPEVDTYTDAVEVSSDALSTAETEMNETEEAVRRLTDATSNASGAAENFSEATETVTTSSAELVNKAREAAQTLQDSYDEAYSAAYKSISSQIGLFEKMKTETDLSVGGMMEALDSQINYMNTYAENMKRASEMGIDEGLLKHLNDGSQESAGILAKMVTMTEEEVKEMNAKWEKVEEGKDTFSSAMAEYTGELEDEKNAMVDLAHKAGMEISGTLTDELLNGVSGFHTALQQYFNELKTLRIETSNAINGVQSVSRNSSNRTNSTYRAYAEGTASATAGLALVGEYGPELVYFRGGERVLTAEETRSALASVYPTAPQMGALGATAPAIAGRGAIQLQARIEVPVEVDGREVARATAVYMGEELYYAEL